MANWVCFGEGIFIIKGHCYILGIETSCDETAAAVVESGRRVLTNVVASQVRIHHPYGGVVPEVASRKHTEVITCVIDKALDGAGISLSELSAIAVTYGPGLLGSLIVGLSAAKAIAWACQLPLVGVHHIEAHIYANFLEPSWLTESWNDWPLLILVVSGGHTELVLMSGHGKFQVLGSTRDDAVGEAYDKGARLLGLGYPGGPEIDRVALEGNPKAVDFPRAVVDGFDFSFSGLKTSLVVFLSKLRRSGLELRVADVAASFQESIVDMLIDKTFQAVEEYGVKHLALAGGVAANRRLRERFAAEVLNRKIRLSIPSVDLCTDNAAMVAAAGYYHFARGHFTTDFRLDAAARVKLGS